MVNKITHNSPCATRADHLQVRQFYRHLDYDENFRNLLKCLRFVTKQAWTSPLAINLDDTRALSEVPQPVIAP